MEVKGYKAFKKGLKNKYGVPFEINVIYSKDPDKLKFGEGGSGFHMALKLADTFRFFNPCLDNVFCEVVGMGKIIKQDDHLYDSDSMYVVEKIKIVKVLSREDIFQYVTQADEAEFRRCLALFPFTKDELEYLRNLVIKKGIIYEELFQNGLKYQTGDISSFKRNSEYLRR